MAKTFQTVEGVSVTNLDGIKEGYSIKKLAEDRTDFILNVSAENMDVVFRKLCAVVRSPGFLLLELGTNAIIEETLRKTNTTPFHKDVFYMDGLDYPKFLKTYSEYADLLINDGMVNYGYGSHEGLDEVFVAEYKIISIMTDDAEKYRSVLKELGYRERVVFKTVWQNFSKLQPGHKETVTRNGIDSYDMVERLKEKGLYFAERREDT